MLTASQQVGLVQAGFAPLALVAGGLQGGWSQGWSAAYGVLVAALVTGVLVWRERQSMAHPEWDQKKLLALFIRTGLERVVVLMVLLTVGFAVLGLRPLPLLLGLIAAQSAWLAVALAGGRSR